jgi:hypothetical protein
MIAIAIYSAGRVMVSLLRKRETERDADGLHVAMGVAMAGMLEPQLSPLPNLSWEVVFGCAAAWFAVRAALRRLGGAQGRLGCRYPLPHLVESMAMLYMLAAVDRTPLGGRAAMTMPGMGGTAGGLPVLAVMLALFMLGYVFWTADRLTSLARAGSGGGDKPAQSAGLRGAAAPGARFLGPGLAGCSKIAMGITMGYMLILMA